MVAAASLHFFSAAKQTAQCFTQCPIVLTLWATGDRAAWPVGATRVDGLVVCLGGRSRFSCSKATTHELGGWQKTGADLTPFVDEVFLIS